MPDLNVPMLASIGAAALGALALASALIAWISMRRWRARHAALESSVDALRRELELLASISVRTGRRVQRVEQEYSGVADRMDLVESRGASGSFDHAIDWARRGADPSQLTQQFGLSCSEAELVSRLHGRKERA
jgi:Protein of unknown function (DUF2802)